MYRYYIRFDADNIGDKIEYNLLCGDLIKAQEVHETIQESIKIIKNKITSSSKYVLLMSGCDDILIGTNITNIAEIEEFTNNIRFSFQNSSNETLSAGIGETIVDCLVNLRKAKTAGKNVTIK
ncbi:mCpol domain-containing protein [Paenibacillus sp. 843]|uniref:mCpol domain-containing protein n=1 Tax=Paenibacillus sp. 843 TaxID=3341795 RepID=UPI003729EF41